VEQLSIATVDKKRDFSAEAGFHGRGVPRIPEKYEPKPAPDLVQFLL
jgi:hypothetical protein